MQDLLRILRNCQPQWESGPSKMCARCGEDRPESGYYLTKNPYGSVYRMNICKACVIKRVISSRRKKRAA